MTRLKHNSFRKITAVLLLNAFLLSGCAFGDKNSSPDKYSQINETKGINDTHVMDNSQLYADDDPYSVTTMYLTVSKGNESDKTDHTWSEINTYSTYYYNENSLDRYNVEGLLQVGDESGPKPGELGYGVTTPNSTVQIRGQTSSKAKQKSYQIKMKKDKGLWREQRTIILNKHVFEYSRFRNKMTYDLMTGYPSLISARTEFVHLYVRDLTKENSGGFDDYGLYTQVEQMNSRYLRTHGLDENGQFYKASMFEFLQNPDALKLTTDSGYDKKAFEEILEIKGSDDHSKLINMLNDLNNFAMPIEEVITKYFDEENYFTWLAFQNLIGNTDITSQNFFLYSPKNSNKFYFISWDNDGAWDHIRRIRQGGEGYKYTEGITNYWGTILHQRILKSENMRNKLKEKIEYFRKELSKEKLTGIIEKYRAVVEPYLFRMPDIEHVDVTQSEFKSYVKSMVEEIDYNYDMDIDSFTRPMPFYTNIPVINDNMLSFTWDNSYDFNNESLTYTFELSRDYNFNSAIEKKTDINIPNANVSMLPDGQYFFRVTVKNKSGKTQTAMDIYEDINDIKHYGVTDFYIVNGKIVTDHAA